MKKRKPKRINTYYNRVYSPAVSVYDSAMAVVAVVAVLSTRRYYGRGPLIARVAVRAASHVARGCGRSRCRRRGPWRVPLSSLLPPPPPLGRRRSGPSALGERGDVAAANLVSDVVVVGRTGKIRVSDISREEYHVMLYYFRFDTAVYRDNSGDPAEQRRRFKKPIFEFQNEYSSMIFLICYFNLTV